MADTIPVIIDAGGVKLTLPSGTVKEDFVVITMYADAGVVSFHRMSDDTNYSPAAGKKWIFLKAIVMETKGGATTNVIIQQTDVVDSTTGSVVKLKLKIDTDGFFDDKLVDFFEVASSKFLTFSETGTAGAKTYIFLGIEVAN